MVEKLIFCNFLCIFSLTDNWTMLYICMDFSPVGNETLILEVVMYKPHKQLQHEIKHFCSVASGNYGKDGELF